MTKVSLIQKSFGTAELVVGSESMLVNCPIFYKWLCTKSEFTFPNAFLRECHVKVLEDRVVLRLEEAEAEVDKKHFLDVVGRFRFDLLENGETYVDIRAPKSAGSVQDTAPSVQDTALSAHGFSLRGAEIFRTGNGGGTFDFDY